MKIKNTLKNTIISNQKASTLMELILVVVLFIVLVPASLNIFLSAQRIGGQSYIQADAANAMGEVNDILRFLRNQNFELLANGEFYLIRNPGTGSWLVKNDLPDTEEILERKITISDALRHDVTDQLYLDGDSGSSYADINTKKIDISVLWYPDYLPLDEIAHTVYISDWQNTFTYPSA